MHVDYDALWDKKQHPDCILRKCIACSNHFHSSIEIVYVSKGMLTVTIEQETYILTENQVLIIPSYYIHSFPRIDEVSDTYIITIPILSVSRYMSYLNEVDFSVLCKSVSSEDELVRQILLLYDVSKKGTMYANIIENGCGQTILGLLIDMLGVQEKKRDRITNLSLEIMLYIENSDISQISLSSVSNHFGYTENYFSNLFNRVFHFNFTSYLNTMRCKKATELMQNMEYSMAEIAFSVGYNSVRSFYRNFKMIYGVSPKNFACASTRIR